MLLAGFNLPQLNFKYNSSSVEVSFEQGTGQIDDGL